jgi:radical SAM protein with 4Fe4S-binding SPASM domain
MDINIKRLDDFNKSYNHKVASFSFPIFSSIEMNIHGSCNRRCAFCPRVDEHLYPNLNEYLDLHFFEKLLTELKKNNYEGRMGFSGFSEPLMHPEINQLVSMFKKYLPNNRLEIVTNGDFLTRESCESLFNSGVFNIRVSLYTNHKTEKNFLEIKKDLNLSDEQLIIRHRNMGSKNDFGLVINNRAGAVDYSRIGKKEKIVKLPLKQACNYPLFKLFIDYNGDCHLCSNDWKKKKIIGNAKEELIYKIWSNNKINQARKKLLNKDRSFQPCQECDVNGILNGNEFINSWNSYLKI